MRLISPMLAVLLALSACKSPQQAGSVSPAQQDNETTFTEFRELDTMVIAAPRIDEEEPEVAYSLPTYNSSYKRVHDLLHTRLDLRFDWEREAVLGKAELTFTPLFYASDKLILDAKGFEVNSITLNNGQVTPDFAYDGSYISITLDKTYTRADTFQVLIDYTAFPAKSGGSAAITSDQGLFFINPRGEEPNKPQQIWTQGETEWNSKWFPTVDKPNERTTQEMILTVEDRFVTLSNGLLVSSEKNADGTRTDYWKMDLPHAPYLFMIAVGEYAVVKDDWQGIPVDYYVEPEYEADARAIFSNTPEMLSFFSDRLQVDYPWPKFSQVVVRDYVSGAMENTSAVIYGEFVQKSARELIDDLQNEKIVAHEMFHHWFGDYVTCESWANLTMNEGFANYSEYLWLEFRYGKDEADYHLINEWSGYLSSAQGSNAHPLIHFGHENKEEMFDAHSYNKGGSVLHMLRNYVGDEAFWEALNLYLTENAFQAVEAHNLRLAFEKVTGEDLNWFFNQWYFASGHPVLDIAYDYDATAKEAIVRVTQQQDPDFAPAIFELPVSVDVYLDEETKVTHEIRVRERVQEFRFPAEKAPRLVNFDADKVLLAETNDNKGEEEYLFQFYHSDNFMDRFEALSYLRENESASALQVFRDALTDDFWVIRAIGATNLGSELPETVVNQIRQMATKDPHSDIRAVALGLLKDVQDEGVVELAAELIGKDPSYTVVSAALEVLMELDRDRALAYTSVLENEKSAVILEAISGLYGETGDLKYLPFFMKNMGNAQVDGYAALAFFTNFFELVKDAELSQVMELSATVQQIGLSDAQSPWRKLSAMKMLNDLRNHYQEKSAELKSDPTAQQAFQDAVQTISDQMKAVTDAESNEQLKTIYINQFQLIEKP
ncbi:MAG: alanyl aminopeptidase [Saprospiraceae bacterium]|nr:alanyl aminopeptidase [Saprospiraceae bacterium]